MRITCERLDVLTDMDPEEAVERFTMAISAGHTTFPDCPVCA